MSSKILSKAKGVSNFLTQQSLRRPKINFVLFRLFLVMFMLPAFFTVLSGNNDKQLKVRSFFSTPIIYESDAAVFFKFQLTPSADISSVEYRVHNSSGTITQQGQLRNNELFIENLRVGAYYEISLMSDTETHGPFPFRTSFSNEVSVDEQLFRNIGAWANKEGQDVPLPEHLSSIEKAFNKFELASFIQQFILRRYPIPDELGTEFSIDELLAVKKILPDQELFEDNDCSCDLIVNYNNNFAPGYLQSNPCDGIGPDIWSEHLTSPKTIVYDVSAQGAAKYAELRIDDTHDDVEYEISTFGQGNSNHIGGSPFHAKIAYHYTCLDNSSVPSNCACEKNVNLSYAYNTKLRAHAPEQCLGLTIFGACAGLSAGSTAVAEDYALFVERTPSSTTLLQAGRARIKNSCNSGWNPDWWANFGSFAEEVITFIQDPQVDGVSEFVDAIVDQAEIAFLVTSGDCTMQEQWGTLISDSETRTLIPNEPKEFYLFSFSYLGARGYGKYKPQARILSDFHLSAVVTGETSHQGPEYYCCTPKLANYISSGVPGAPLDEQDSKAAMGSWIDLYGPWDNFPENPWTGIVELPCELGVESQDDCPPDPTCSDGILNQGEQEIDCGGPCPPCPTCYDNVQNQDESGVDCGGSCPPCATCFDNIQNQGETDVDCGGPCAPCPSCDDNIQNQGETGVDCGGPCINCPTCNDYIQNQGETGIDCGGPCPVLCPSCIDGIQNQGELGVDCGGPCREDCPPSCDDGIQNQGECGIDCGGPCPPCSPSPPCAPPIHFCRASVSMSPNPFSDLATVEYKIGKDCIIGEIEGTVQPNPGLWVKFKRASGRFEVGPIAVKGLTGTIEIDARAWPKGTYIVELYHVEEGTLDMIKVLKL